MIFENKNMKNCKKTRAFKMPVYPCHSGKSLAVFNTLICKNKPNFVNETIDTSTCNTEAYNTFQPKKTNPKQTQNKPKQSQLKTNFQNGKIPPLIPKTRKYLLKANAKQTQSKPNQNPIKANLKELFRGEYLLHQLPTSQHERKVSIGHLCLQGL